MNMEIAIVETFCGFGLNVLKKQPFWPIFIRSLAISYEKNLETLALIMFGCSRRNAWNTEQCFP